MLFSTAPEWYDMEGNTQTLDNVKVGESGIALGPNNSATTTTISIGQNLRNEGYDNVLIGSNTNIYGHVSDVAIGANAICTNSNAAVVIGANAKVEDDGGIAIGANAKSIFFDQGYYSVPGGIAIGINSKTRGGIVIGHTDHPSSENGLMPNCVIIGNNANANTTPSPLEGVNDTGVTLIGANAYTNSFGGTGIGYEARAINGSLDLTFSDGSIGRSHAKIVAGTTSWNILSDERIKENIAEADTSLCLSSVESLPVKRFTMKKFTGSPVDIHQTGFIAQDMEKVFPKLVHKGYEEYSKVDEDGHLVLQENGEPEKIIFEDLRRIEREPLIPVLWGAVQELSKQIKELKAQISELKN